MLLESSKNNQPEREITNNAWLCWSAPNNSRDWRSSKNIALRRLKNRENRFKSQKNFSAVHWALRSRIMADFSPLMGTIIGSASECLDESQHSDSGIEENWSFRSFFGLNKARRAKSFLVLAPTEEAWNFVCSSFVAQYILTQANIILIQWGKSVRSGRESSSPSGIKDFVPRR